MHRQKPSNNRADSNHNVFTTQLIQLVKRYVPEDASSRILKQFKEKSIKEQLTIVENYINHKKQYAPQDNDLRIDHYHDFDDGSFDYDVFTVTYKKEIIKNVGPMHFKTPDVSKEKLMKLEEINKNEKFQSEFNKIKNQYTRFFNPASSFFSSPTEKSNTKSSPNKSSTENNPCLQATPLEKNTLPSSSASNKQTSDHKAQSSTTPELTMDSNFLFEENSSSQTRQQEHSSNQTEAKPDQPIEKRKNMQT